MNAIEIIGLSWNEMKISCLKNCWNRLLVQTLQNELINEVPQNVAEITEIARQIGFEEVDQENVQELIEDDYRELSNEDLIDNLEQIPLEITDSDSEGQQNTRILTKKCLEHNVSVIQNALEDLFENDPNFERSAAIKRGVMDVLSPYLELLKEKKNSKAIYSRLILKIRLTIKTVFML